MNLAALPLIPWPQQIELGSGSFQVEPETYIQVPAQWHSLGDYLTATSGLQLAAGSPSSKAGTISIVPASEAAMGPEAYRLQVDTAGLRIEASQAAGAFYGIQTLLQLIADGAAIPALSIQDEPRVAWRGLMLDVARHFFPVSVVKQVIDWLAVYKFNRLHLHLTDDQGWRIEINRWPRLTEIGGSTAVGGGPGGFYSQADYAEIVDYAASRFITVVPEIDLPGHTQAALASYPELNCDGQPVDLYSGIEVGFSSLCIDKDVTYRFVEDVLGEMAALTPGPWLHIGGDEAHSTAPEDYRRFIERVQGLVAAQGKILVGWQEAAKAALPPGSLLQYWDERLPFDLPEDAALIASPGSKAYLDMKYDADSPLGLEWAGHIGVRTAYEWDPADMLAGLPEARIAGVEAALWSETLQSQADIEYMLFPRLPGIGEIGWSARGGRDWQSYRARLTQHARRWEQSGLNWRPSPELE